MPWTIHRHLLAERAQPVLLWNDCFEPITPHDIDCVAWQDFQAPRLGPREIRFLHQRCLDSHETMSPFKLNCAWDGRDDNIEHFCRRMFGYIAALACAESRAEAATHRR